jgi:hypothetical protein
VFTHVVAERGNPHWKAVPTTLLPVEYDAAALLGLWRRIWSE